MLTIYLLQTPPQSSGMTLEDWANAFQIFEAIVVALSVGLILYQVSQQTKLAKANNNNTLFESYSSFYTELIKDKDMAEIVVEGHKKYETEYKNVDQFRYRASLAWRLTLQENIYYQHENGLLAGSIFKGWEADFRFFIKRRHLKLRWHELQNFYHTDFRAYVQKLIDEVDPDAIEPAPPPAGKELNPSKENSKG